MNGVLKTLKITILIDFKHNNVRCSQNATNQLQSKICIPANVICILFYTPAPNLRQNIALSAVAEWSPWLLVDIG